MTNDNTPIDLSPSLGGAREPPRPWWHVRRGMLVALLLSLGVHLAVSLIPDQEPETPDSIPLTATIQEIPPPPAPAAVPSPTPSPKAKPKPAPVAPPAPVASAPEPSPAAETAPTAEPEQALAEEHAAPPTAEPFGPPALAEAVEAPVTPPIERKTLPPRIDLSYQVFYGTQGFLIGAATYRLEHADNRYRIATVGEARGLAALLLRGRGRMESRGLITPAGLQPHEFIVDRFNKRGAERAEFDWENGVATLHDNQVVALELPTFDLLALMWQFYFQPPESDRQSFALATTRRVNRVTVARERKETISWANGPIETEVWHRTSEDGKTEAYAWLAPSLRWIPVKMRVVNTTRGTIEALLDQIRVDEPNGVAIQ